MYDKSEDAREKAMNEKKLKYPLKLKAALIVIAMAAVLCATALIVSSVTFSHTNEEIFKKEAKDLAYTAALSVDGDALKVVADRVSDIFRSMPEDELVTSEDWGSPEFEAYLEKYSEVMDMPEFVKVHEQLSKVQHGGIDVLSSIYTIMYDNTRSQPFAIYLVDAADEDACLPGVLDTFNPDDYYEVLVHPENGITPYSTETE